MTYVIPVMSESESETESHLHLVTELTELLFVYYQFKIIQFILIES